MPFIGTLNVERVAGASTTYTWSTFGGTLSTRLTDESGLTTTNAGGEEEFTFKHNSFGDGGWTGRLTQYCVAGDLTPTLM